MKGGKTEKQIVNEILKYLNGLECCRAVKVHGGRYGNSGEPDIDCVYRGRSYKFEVKRPKNKPTQLQMSVMDKWREAGACVCWVTDVREVINVMTGLD